MNTSPLDFLLSGVCLLLLAAVAGAVSFVLLGPYSAIAFGRYGPLVDVAAFLLVFGLGCAALSRLLLRARPLVPGQYSMDDSVFTYWKLLTVLYEFGRGALLPCTTVFARPLVAKLFGAEVGGETALGGRIADPSLVHIARGAVLGHNSVLTPHVITSGKILLQDVRIGAGATVGVNVVVNAGVDVGENSVVAAGSVIAPFTRIPPGELWGGVPARRIKALEASDQRG